VTGSSQGPGTELVPVCPNPIFIIGAERSGTTILALCLGQHSDLWYSCEGHFFPGFFEQSRLDSVYRRGKYRYRWVQEEGVSREEFLEYMGLGVNALFTNRSGGRRWLEKTPQNTLMVGVLASMYPAAFFVHILRDGREVVNSMLHFLNEMDDEMRDDRVMGGVPPKWAVDFRCACKTWSEYVEKAFEFGQECPERCLTVRYEHLITQPGAIFAEIFDFIGVPNDDGPIEHFRTNHVNSSFGEYRQTAPSVAWQTWSAEQQRVFVDECGRTLVNSGIVTEKELNSMEKEVQEGESGPLETVPSSTSS
jgi:Sulfotransferase family